jgi:hypothetical protein
MGVWKEVAMDSLKFHPGPPCPTLLGPVGRPPLKQPYSRFRGGPLDTPRCTPMMWIKKITLFIPGS